jgi:hypothetical protein
MIVSVVFRSVVCSLIMEFYVGLLTLSHRYVKDNISRMIASVGHTCSMKNRGLVMMRKSSCSPLIVAPLRKTYPVSDPSDVRFPLFNFKEKEPTKVDSFSLVAPAGIEPAISWMRTKCPGPLDDGALALHIDVYVGDLIHRTRSPYTCLDCYSQSAWFSS